MVGVNRFRENWEALADAQELTNSRAKMFHVTIEGSVLVGLICSVNVNGEYFELQLPDGTKTERLDINKLEKIEAFDNWKFDFQNN